MSQASGVWKKDVLNWRWDWRVRVVCNSGPVVAVRGTVIPWRARFIAPNPARTVVRMIFGTAGIGGVRRHGR